ncbi:hypothetical protein DFS34DRAFT_623567 [Phlyctochytrium arcticum]|nr:hypothetical protein DFS34DRAFT_623567 [Phlyctochytrium arcticum]
MVSTILLTGALGHTASALQEMLPKQIKQIPVSLSQIESNQIESLFDGVSIDAIYLVPPQTIDAVERVRLLLEAARQHRVKYIVMLSIVNASAHHTRIAERYAQMEHYLQFSEIPFTILRTVPLQQLFLHLKYDFHQTIPTIAFPIANGGFAPIHASDVARCAATLLLARDHSSHVGETYTLTGPDLLTGVEIAGRASGALDRPVRFRNGSFAQSRAQLHRSREEGGCDHLQEWYIRDVLEIFSAIAAGHYATLENSVFRLSGRQAIPIESFFREHHEQFDTFDTFMDSHEEHRKRSADGIAAHSADYVHSSYKGTSGAGIGRYVVFPFAAKL